MSVIIDNIRFTDEYTGVLGGFGSDTGTDFLMGCVGDKMWTKIDFHVEWHTLDQPMQINVADQSITRQDVTGSFIIDEFSAGDTIVLHGAGMNDGSYVIASLTDTEIFVSMGILSQDGLFGSADIYGTTDIDWIDFYYNCIANSSQADFQSLSDVNTQKFSNVDKVDDNTVDLAPATKQYAWNDIPKGSAKLTEVSTYGYPSYAQYFSITIPFFIKPFFLNGQQESLRNLLADTSLTPPDYFRDLDCLKFVYKINARYEQRDPVIKHTSELKFKDGNTGWFNELLDGNPLIENGIVQFNLISTQYFDNATGYPVTNLDYIDKTDVQITIQCPEGVSPIDAPFVVNFMWIPNSNTPYQNKGIKDYTDDFGQPNDFRHLFLHDRAKQIEGTAAVNGDRFATDYQVLTNIVGSNYGTELIVTFTVNMGSIVSDTFKNNEFGRDYIIWVTPQAPPTPAP